MNRALPITEAENCDHCPAFMTGMGAMARASGFSVIPSRLTAQVTDGDWNAVVTTLGRGTFLIRRRTELSAETCPLRAYEIRHIAKEPSSAQERSGEFGGPHPERPDRTRVGFDQNTTESRTT